MLAWHVRRQLWQARQGILRVHWRMHLQREWIGDLLEWPSCQLPGQGPFRSPALHTRSDVPCTALILSSVRRRQQSSSSTRLSLPTGTTPRAAARGATARTTTRNWSSSWGYWGAFQPLPDRGRAHFGRPGQGPVRRIPAQRVGHKPAQLDHQLPKPGPFARLDLAHAPPHRVCPCPPRPGWTPRA